MDKRITYLNVVKEQIAYTHHINHRNYGIKPEILMDELAYKSPQEVIDTQPSKHVAELTNFLKRLDQI